MQGGVDSWLVTYQDCPVTVTNPITKWAQCVAGVAYSTRR